MGKDLFIVKARFLSTSVYPWDIMKNHYDQEPTSLQNDLNVLRYSS